MGVPITIACSGLGHIRRGNETWARDVADALHKAGADVLLLGGGPRPESDCPYRQLLNLPREFPVFRHWISWSRRYLAEQLSFMFSLRRELRRSGRKIVHLCDPDLALQLHRRTPGSGILVAFKDGMRLGPAWCRRIPFVQVLAPYYRDVVARDAGVDTTRWFVIPHLVDGDRFRPAPDRAAARAAWPELRLPPEAFVVLGVGDFSVGGNKRLDWLVNEVARMPPSARAHLVLAGQASTSEFDRFAAEATGAIGDRIRLLRNLPRAQVARLYQVADVFAHAALHEPFGIVFLEAMATALPVLAHTWEVSRWIVGDAGEAVDMTVPGAMAGALRHWSESPMEREAIGERARRRALDHFSPAGLVPRYLEMYECMDRAARAADGRAGTFLP